MFDLRPGSALGLDHVSSGETLYETRGGLLDGSAGVQPQGILGEAATSIVGGIASVQTIMWRPIAGMSLHRENSSSMDMMANGGINGGEDHDALYIVGGSSFLNHTIVYGASDDCLDLEPALGV